MSLGVTPENINTESVVQARRCCSFCKNNGHNISTCNDIRFTEFQELCVFNYSNMSREHFNMWLENYSRLFPDIVRAYAIRYCGCTIRQYMFSFIQSIIVRIQTITSNSRDNSVSDEIEQPQLINTSENWFENRFGRLMEYQRDELLRNINHNGIRNHNPQDLLAANMLIDLLLMNKQQPNINKKFNIKTKIIEYSDKDECECSICYENKEKLNFIKLNCGHEFCKDCFKQTLKNVRTCNPRCAFCRAEIQNIELSSNLIRNELDDILLTTI